MSTPDDEYLEILQSMTEHALESVKLGRIEDATELWGECLELHQTALGPAHENTLLSMANLAFCQAYLGRYEEAEELHRTCWQLRETSLGTLHPDTLRSLVNHAFCLRELARYEESEAQHRLCLERREQLLGPSHPDTLVSMFAHARALNLLGFEHEAGEQASQCFRRMQLDADFDSDRWEESESRLLACCAEVQKQLQQSEEQELQSHHSRSCSAASDEEQANDCLPAADTEMEQVQLRTSHAASSESSTDNDSDEQEDGEEEGGIDEDEEANMESCCCICFQEFSVGDPPASHADAEGHGIVFVCNHASGVHLSCLLLEATQDRPFHCPLCRCKFGFSKQCICGCELQERRAKEAPPGYDGAAVKCDHCDLVIPRRHRVFRCPRGKTEAHPSGYDVCWRCASNDSDAADTREHDPEFDSEERDSQEETENVSSSSTRASGRPLDAAQALRLAESIVSSNGASTVPSSSIATALRLQSLRRSHSSATNTGNTQRAVQDRAEDRHLQSSPQRALRGSHSATIIRQQPRVHRSSETLATTKAAGSRLRATVTQRSYLSSRGSMRMSP